MLHKGSDGCAIKIVNKIFLKESIMTTYQAAQMFLTFIESKTSHSRPKTLAKLEELGLHNSMLFELIEGANTNIGRLQLKELWLQAFIHSLQK